MSRSSLRRWRAAAPIVVIAVVTTLAACSTEVEVRTTATGERSPISAADTGDPPGPDAEASPPADDGDAAGSGDPDAEAPLRTPARGEAVAVVGVAFDETIAVRAAPRPGERVVTELPARFDDAIGTGQARTDAATGWWEILVGDDRGWVDAASMARLGVTTEVTADVVEALGATPDAPTMRALGRLVAQARVDADGGGGGRIVLSGAPVAGDLGEVVYDVVGRADASVAGERLVVFGVPADDSDGFVLRSVESTILCARGVTADGRCT